MSRQYRTRGNRKSTSRAGKTRRKESHPEAQASPQAASSAAQDAHPTIQLPLDRGELLALAQESLHTFAVEIGLRIAGKLLEDEVDRLCGTRYTRPLDRTATRHGHQKGVITVAGQKLPIARPRVRAVGGGAEVDLETYSLLQQDNAMPSAVLRRMVNGVSCRNYEQVIDVACEGFGVQKSSVSRSFVRASSQAIRELVERTFTGMRFAAIMIDGIDYAGETMIVALGITTEGHKLALGLRQGATENAEVVTSLLEELRDRGIATDQPTLFVLDGSKALAAGVKRVWGTQAIVQRCQIHKKRNVMAHVPATHAEEIERDLDDAWGEKNYDAAEAKLKRLQRRLQSISPDAASSLAEGLEETITVIRLKLPAVLVKTLKSTNPIESAIDTVRTLTGRVKRWRDGDMRLRWCSAGLLRAEKKFRRLKGYRQIPQLIAALDAQLLDSKKKTG